MNKVKLILIAAGILSMTACNFELPEKISVKSNAEYNFGVGSINKDISEYVKINELIKEDSLKSINGKVYDYFPNEADPNTQRFLIKIPFIEVPIDIGKYYDESALSAAIQDFSFEKSIEIPEVEFNQDIEISDLSSLSSSLNALVTFAGAVSTADSFDVTINPGAVAAGNDFSSIYYNNCTFVIDNLTGIADGVVITISSKGKSASGTVSSGSATITINEPFEITKNSLKVKFNTPQTGSFAGHISSGSINTVTGLTIASDPSLPSAVNANINIPSGTFEECEIGEGSLKVPVIVPNTWSGVTITKDISASGTALTISPASSSPNISLAGKTLKPGATTVTVDNVKFHFANATVKFADKPKISAGIKITKFNKIILAVAGLTQSLDKKDAFPESVRKTIKGITLAPSGLKGTYINTFPAGNDITVTAKSDFFDFGAGKIATLTSGTSTRTAFTDMLCADNRSVALADTTNTSKTPPEFKEWDINIKVDLPGSADGKIEIVNVKPKETYTIGLTITPVLDWKSVEIDSQVFNSTAMSDKKSLGFNLSSLLKEAKDKCGMDLSDGIEFMDLPVYIRAEKPEMNSTALNGFGFEGTITLLQSSDGTTAYDLGASEGLVKEDIINNSTISLCESIPEYKTKNKVLVTDVSSYPNSLGRTINLAPFFNKTLKVPDSSGTELWINYSVKMTCSDPTITITKDDLASDNTKSTLSAYALIEIPLKFKAIKDVEVDIKDVAKLKDDEDLFKRESASSLEQVTKYMDLLESCTVYYKPIAIPLIATKDPEVRIKLFSSSTEKILGMQGGSFEVTHDDAKKMFDTYPFAINSAKAVLPDGSVVSLPRNLNFGANLSVKLVTNGEIDIMGGKQ